MEQPSLPSRVRDEPLPPLVIPADETIKHVYLPGDAVSLPGVDMNKCIQGRGIGRLESGKFIAHQLGTVERMNQMIMVQSRGGRYNANVGDLVVGRITDVNFASSSWSVEIKGYRQATLPLAAVVLPCGTQRRRNEQDQLAMRELFDVDDVIIAEIQRVGRDNQSVALHTRSVKFGKLENGTLIEVAPSLIVRSDKHMANLSLGNEETRRMRTITDGVMSVDGTSVFVVLGVNGFIWVGAPQPVGDQDGVNYAENAAEYNKVEMKLRTRIARVRAAVSVLADNHCAITWGALESVIEASCAGGLNLSVQEMYDPTRKRELLNLLLSSGENI